jgi:uncharacterized protein
MRNIRFTAGEIVVIIALNDTQTANALWDALPITARANTWGDEIYFAIPVYQEEDNAQEIVALGDVGYWPPGHAFCLFFGRTPVSRGNEIRPASPVNVLGQIEGQATILARVPDGARVALERVG